MNEQLIKHVEDWAKTHPNFLENFLAMIQEYRALAEAAGVEVEDLTATKACLTQVSELFESLEVTHG